MDPTVAAIPAYVGTMGAEHLWLRAHAAARGPTAAPISVSSADCS